MLHFILSILLGILKIIGILLLTVLVLLLLVLSAILFGPVRYRIRAAKTEEALEAAVTVSWLHLIRARLLLDGRKQTHALDIRIFGISLTKLKEWLDRRKQRKSKKDQAVNQKKVARRRQESDKVWMNLAFRRIRRKEIAERQRAQTNRQSQARVIS